jgi:hypothetical protein
LLIFKGNSARAEVFLYFAIVQGLAKDGIPTSVAQSVLKETKGNNFVPKCKICESTKHAFSTYVNHGATYSTDTNPYPDLASDDVALRHNAIKKAIDKYTSSFLTLLNLSTIEMEQLENTLAAMRKQGMTGLNSNFGSKSCPSCDGATHED